MEGLAWPCRPIDLGLRMSHILCFWSLWLGEISWPKSCQRICRVGSGMITSPPPRKGNSAVKDRSLFSPLAHS